MEHRSTAALQSELLPSQALPKPVCIKSSSQEWDTTPYQEVLLYHGVLKHLKNQGYLSNWKLEKTLQRPVTQESKTSLNGLFLQWRKSQKECQAVNGVRKWEFVVLELQCNEVCAAKSVACFVSPEEQYYLKDCGSSLSGYSSLNLPAWRKVSVTEHENKCVPPLKCSCLVNLQDDIFLMYQSPL